MGQGFPFYYKIRERLCDALVNELGINRLRVEVFGYTESKRQDGDKEKPPIQNDNGDPSEINWGGFQLEALDRTIEDVVLPFRKRLEQRGERLYISICYVNFQKTFLHRDHPQEYAELMLAVFLHLRDKYKLTPEALETILEPDNAQWNGADIGKAMRATASVLKSHGFSPEFIAPSTASMAKAVLYFDDMIRVDGVLNLLNEFSYHRYRAVSKQALTQIAARAKRYGMRTSMLEHIGADASELREDLLTGNVSSWQQYTLAYPGVKDPAGAYYRIDASDPTNPTFYMAKHTKLLRQYFRYIRRGAVRIESTSSDGRFYPAAFINATGKYVVVVPYISGEELMVKGLPRSDYVVTFATRDSVDFPEEIIPAGQPVIIRQKYSNGICTIYGK